MQSDLAGTDTIHISTTRGGSMFSRYFSEFKEFKIEDLLGDTLPSYFIYTDIE